MNLNDDSVLSWIKLIATHSVSMPIHSDDVHSAQIHSLVIRSLHLVSSFKSSVLGQLFRLISAKYCHHESMITEHLTPSMYSLSCDVKSMRQCDTFDGSQ